MISNLSKELPSACSLCSELEDVPQQKSNGNVRKQCTGCCCMERNIEDRAGNTRSLFHSNSPIAWPAHSELATWFYTRLRSSGLMCACVFRSRSPSAPCDYTASNRMARTHRTRGPAPLVQKLQLCGFGMRVLFDYAAFSVQFAALLNFLRLPHPHVYRITEVFIREAFLSVKPELTYTR